MTIILDPGHGMSNRRSGVFDPGACSGVFREADIALDWANELRAILLAAGHRVVRTRIDHKDPARISQRAAIARKYGGEIMLSIHCNSTPGAQGTETIYRRASNKPMATRINTALVDVLGTVNRGVKTEMELGRGKDFTLAVMSFQPCFLLELGFIDNAGDRAKMLDPVLRKAACNAIARALA